MSYNPYQEVPSNPVPGKPDKGIAESKVKTPAILLIVSGVISMLFNVVGGVSFAVMYIGMKDELMPQILEQQNNPDLTPEMMEMIFNMYGYGGIASAVLGLIAGTFVIFAAVRMMKLKGWTMALMAAILSLIPCFQGCCLLSIPVGIYALVILFDSNVKPAFD